jgi:outer membrane murein-binding lipoprotein Lpp
VRRLALAGLIAAAPVALTGTAGAQSCESPQYLGFTEFVVEDSPPQIASRQAYNTAVERYNKAVYDYCVTWNRHSQLVELYNGTVSPAERDRARAEAGPLRTKLDTLRREVAALASMVDQARRRAAQAGVAITR